MEDQIISQNQMPSVQILRKKVRIAVKDGDNLIGEIAFNPDNTSDYAKFVDLIDILANGKKDIEKIKFTAEDSAALENTLENIDEFESAKIALGKIRDASKATGRFMVEVCAGLDDLFGPGVCQLFTGGADDPELLVPLLDCVLPYYTEARQAKAKPYLKSQ